MSVVVALSREITALVASFAKSWLDFRLSCSPLSWIYTSIAGGGGSHSENKAL